MQLPWVICLVICALILWFSDGELLSYVFMCMKVCVYKVITYILVLCVDEHMCLFSF